MHTFKVLTRVIAGIVAVGVSFMGAAAVQAYTLNSTNELNAASNAPGRPGQAAPHVVLTEAAVGEVTLTFKNPSTVLACFERRIDGQVAYHNGIETNHFFPALSAEGEKVYPYFCMAAGASDRVETYAASQTVEIRHAFGPENDWYFDWATFEALFDRQATIISPADQEMVAGTASFSAVLIDKDQDDAVQWAVRQGTCAAGIGTVAGNVDGFSTPFDWDGMTFQSNIDTRNWDDGNYCFVFNPRESVGDAPIRLTREFSVKNNPTEKDECKKGGWEKYGFSNQGRCIQFVNTGKDSR